MSMQIDQTIDATGLSCPQPLMKISRAAKKMKSGEVVKLIATDPGALEDVPKWAKRTKNEILDQENDGATYTFIVKIS